LIYVIKYDLMCHLLYYNSLYYMIASIFCTKYIISCSFIWIFHTTLTCHTIFHYKYAFIPHLPQYLHKNSLQPCHTMFNGFASPIRICTLIAVRLCFYVLIHFSFILILSYSLNLLQDLILQNLYICRWQ